MQIRLISYNIWHGKYLDRVIEFLRAEKADIVCLQETGTSGQNQQAAEVNLYEAIGRALGIKGVYERMFWGDEGRGKYDMGVAMYSWIPILEKRVFPYERETDRVMRGSDRDRYNLPRKLIGQKLGVGKGGFWVFTTHHTITPYGGVTEHQLENTRKVKDFIASFDRLVLCGDMNTPHGNENYRLLSEGMTDVSGRAPTLHSTIHPAGGKRYHVDYVFYRGKGIKHMSTRIPQVDASDHLPVVVEFEVESTQERPEAGG